MHKTEIARWLGMGGLMTVAAIHANWARGSSWPAPNPQQLAQAVIGGDELPSAAACMAVAGLLTAATGFVGGVPRQSPRLQRLGAAAVVVALSARGAVGALGLLPHDRASQSFARWNRRLYSPLCLTLAALCAVGVFARAE